MLIVDTAELAHDTTLEMVDRLRAAVEELPEGPLRDLVEQAADLVEDLAARVDDLEEMLCPVCGEAAASCGHDPSVPGPEVIPDEEPLPALVDRARAANRAQREIPTQPAGEHNEAGLRARGHDNWAWNNSRP